MKILQVNKLFYPHVGGVEKVVLDLCEQLSGDVGMNVLIANNSFCRKNETIAGANIERVPSVGTLLSMPIAPLFPFHIAKYTAVDLMHFHFPFPLGEISYLMNQWHLKARTVVTWHCDIVRQKKVLKLYTPLLHKFLQSMDCIVTTSPNMIEHSEFLQPYRDKCKVIPLGINPKQFEPNKQVLADAAKIKIRYKRPILFFMGRLVNYKGLSYLIDAMQDINADLLIGGSGKIRLELEQQVQDRGLQDKIHFTGFISDEDLPAYYHASDIFVLPSIDPSEAFGIVQLEAQVCGVPVVSTNLNTGVPYANLNGVTGIVVDPGNSKELSRAINSLLSDDSRRRLLGVQAHERVMSEFTVQAMGKAYFELYKQLCEK
ncbi:glycosyltransferase [Pelosinus sp. IPA-1]|uniref:glycosyltransferase n=1 Tax=Pelosinus sp. IPA-1 TaxID=3029569 RepID=UPI0024361F1C|nr:glycosyltransferase [Pelosinus sp. IPA-1]GMB01655.1 glycosyl transferase family 1 [Pelosinus sp. IPA-1]